MSIEETILDYREKAGKFKSLADIAEAEGKEVQDYNEYLQIADWLEDYKHLKCRFDFVKDKIDSIEGRDHDSNFWDGVYTVLGYLEGENT